MLRSRRQLLVATTSRPGTAACSPRPPAAFVAARSSAVSATSAACARRVAPPPTGAPDWRTHVTAPAGAYVTKPQLRARTFPRILYAIAASAGPFGFPADRPAPGDSPAMMSAPSPTPRMRRAYDHRLREHVPCRLLGPDAERDVLRHGRQPAGRARRRKQPGTRRAHRHQPDALLHLLPDPASPSSRVGDSSVVLRMPNLRTRKSRVSAHAAGLELGTTCSRSLPAGPTHSDRFPTSKSLSLSSQGV
jgi:hypothetical protein